MRRTNPFDNISQNTSLINKNNLKNLHHHNHLTKSLPSKYQIQNNLNNFHSHINNNFNPPPQKNILNSTNYPNMNEKHVSSTYKYNNIPSYPNNIDERGDDKEYNLIKEEYESKMKPFNCSNDSISTITNIFPSDYEAYSQLSMPLSFDISLINNNGNNIPLIDYGENEIPRCKNKNCREYLNPFVNFIDSG